MCVAHNTAPQFRYVPRFQLFNLFGTVASTLIQQSVMLLHAIKHVFEKIAQDEICFGAFRMQHTLGDRGTEVAVVSPGRPRHRGCCCVARETEAPRLLLCRPGDRGTEVAVVSPRHVSPVWSCMDNKADFNFWIFVITGQIQPLRCAAAAFTLRNIIPAIQSKLQQSPRNIVAQPTQVLEYAKGGGG
jgi:hypothetical protein